MRKTRSRFAAAQSEHTSSLRSWAMGMSSTVTYLVGIWRCRRNRRRRTMFQWNRSAADDTAASLQPADVGSAGQVQRGTADKPVAERPAAPPTATSYLLSDNESDERIRQALAKTTEFEFNDLPLRDAVAHVSKQHGIRVWLDERALTDLNITSDTPVTRNLSNVSLKSALRLLLRPLQLNFRVHAGVLQITSQTEYDNQLEIRVYPMGDLVTPLISRMPPTRPTLTR